MSTFGKCVIILIMALTHGVIMIITCRNYELKTSKVPGFHRFSVVSRSIAVILSPIRAAFIALLWQAHRISRTEDQISQGSS
jgi:hypothetical protein